MNFQDIGIIIAKKNLQERSSIISLLTQSHGLHSGVVRNASDKSRFIYQIGNLVDLSWQARLEEHIGSLKCGLIKSYSGCFISDKTKLYAFNSIVSLIKLVFHEREPHNSFFLFFRGYLNNLIIEFDFLEYIKVELELLAQSGYALQLSCCAVTNNSDNLAYVSPKSGRAISHEVGINYADKLLVLPKLLNSTKMVDALDVSERKHALALTNYFFKRYFIHSAQSLQARDMFTELVTR